MRKIKIVHLQLLPLMSGVQRVMVDFLIRLDRKKYEIYVICSGEGDLTHALEKHNISFITIPELRREINAYYDLIVFIKLFRIFKKFKFKIVHTHSSKPGFLGRLAARLAGVPIIIHTVHGFAFHQFSSKINVQIFKLFERIAGTVSDKIILLNDIDLGYAIYNKIGKHRKLVKISNGVFLDQFDVEISIQKKKMELSINQRDFVVGFVGRLWEQKAPQDFIAMIPVVINKIPNVTFIIIGDGHLKNPLIDLAKKLSIQDKIKFLGWRNDVPEIVKIIDVFVQTSLWEGLSLSILEAMACSKPIIATNIKGNNELIIDGFNGFLIPPQNPKIFGEKVLTLLYNQKLSWQMGQNSYQRVKENFRIEDSFSKINSLYEKLLIRNI